MQFQSFGKIPRWHREIVITEKIDGTNACVCISENTGDVDENVIIQTKDYNIRAGSRTRWITPHNDNFGFAAWVVANHEELLTLGVGTHFGEWWGRGIQRGYGMDARFFSLFNVGRWNKDNVPECVQVVPKLYSGANDDFFISTTLDMLADEGSKAAPGYMKPEGIVIFHTAGNNLYKITLEDDDKPKGNAQ